MISATVAMLNEGAWKYIKKAFSNNICERQAASKLND